VFQPSEVFGMKKLFLILFLALTVVHSSNAQSSRPDFPLKVVVSASELSTFPFAGDRTSLYLVLSTELDGQQVRLKSHQAYELLLALGTYDARLLPPGRIARSLPPYLIDRSYELRMPDGKTQTFDVIRIAAIPSHP
jgi:hypothetical protein